MSKYVATIRHHSISRARVVPVGDDLTQAKRRATAEFGGGFIDHVIVILDNDARDDTGVLNHDAVVSSRRVGSRKWQDATDCY
jgi:hypothetical protein